MIKSIIKKSTLLKQIIAALDNQNERDRFVKNQLKKIKKGSLILDAGCGSQRYRDNCSHLEYEAQDFGQYKTDEKKMMGQKGMGGEHGYRYGKLDYVGDIWDIAVCDEKFDAVLCTEVLEHIPFPNEAIKEFGRILKKGGILILTAPSNCLRHMDPYFFYTGFSDRYYEKFLNENGFRVHKILPVGDYYSWMSVEIARTIIEHSFFSKIILFPAFLYYYFKKKSTQSVDTLCMGYHVVAFKY
jgi:SAM-dependent methyltransferase